MVINPVFPLRAEMPPQRDRPGSFCFTQRYNDPPDAPACGIHFICPCGCGAHGSALFRGRGTDGRPELDWDGDRERPTLTPSIQRNSDCRWHGHLTRGYWVLNPGDAPP